MNKDTTPLSLTLEKLIELKTTLQYHFVGAEPDISNVFEDVPNVAPSYFVDEGYAIEFTVQKGNCLQVVVEIDAKDLEEELDKSRFELFQAMEDLLWLGYQEGQNNDPCSFNYDYETNHLDETWTFTVICTDYFS